MQLSFILNTFYWGLRCKKLPIMHFKYETQMHPIENNSLHFHELCRLQIDAPSSQAPIGRGGLLPTQL